MKKLFARGEFLILLTTLCWSTTGLFCVALDGIHPLLIHGIRSLVGAFVLLCFARFRLHFNRTILLSALCIFLSTLCYMCAQDLSTPANAVVLQYSSPIFVLLETCLFYRRSPTLVQLLAVLLTFGGIVVLFATELTLDGLLGNVLGLLSGIFFSGVFFCNKMEDARPLDSLIFGFIGGALVGLFFVGGVREMTGTQLLINAAMGFFNVGIAYIFFSIGIRKCSGFSASLIGTLEVVLLPFWIFLVFGEDPGMAAVVGGIMVLGGIVLNTVHENRLAHAASAKS